jgi:hypothetical protein
MAEPVYEFWRVSLEEAWYQLSEEEQQEYSAKVEAAREKLGVRLITQCSALSSGKWLLWGVMEYPGIEAVPQMTELLYQMNHFRYFETESMLGTKWPPS